MGTAPDGALLMGAYGRPRAETPGVRRDTSILLQSGALLLTYGRWIRPMGCGALLSDDVGQIVTLLYYSSGSPMSASHAGGATCPVRPFTTARRTFVGSRRHSG